MPVRLALPIALTTLLLGLAPAQAADVSVSATVTRGELSTIFPPAALQLPVVDLDTGGDQQIYVDLPFTVADTRGTGAGWSLHVTSDGFLQNLAPMPGTSASIIGATTSCDAPDLCTLPQTSIAYPLAVPVDGVPIRFFNATSGSGMGTTDLTARMAVTVPGNALAGNFETTLTLTQAAGP
jgi:hypothetical protein